MNLLPAIGPDIAPTWYYFCVATSVLIIAISKGGFGGSTGILAIPVMALVMPTQQMLGIMMLVLIVADALSNLHYFREYEWKLLRWLLAGVVPGIGAGTMMIWLIGQADPSTFDRVLKAIIGILCLMIVALQVWRLTGRAVWILPIHPISSATVGLVAGAVSAIAHAAGPIILIYLLQAKLPKRKLVATALLYTLIANPLKVPGYIAIGIINISTLRDCLWFIPLLPVGTVLGAWLNGKISEKPFVIIMYVMATATALVMVVKAMG